MGEIMRGSNSANIVILSAAFMIMSHDASRANESTYTETFGVHCRLISEYELGATHRCPGPGGEFYDISEGDLRFSLSFGVRATDAPAKGWRSFSNFNTVGQKVEWRLNGKGQPFAAIVRYHIDDPDDYEKPAHQVLVVFKVEREAGPCHVGYIDARANAEANALARRVADEVVPGFVCGTDKMDWYGKVHATIPERELQ